jgi:tetratricopeptide (TPR) repeat protein
MKPCSGIGCRRCASRPIRPCARGLGHSGQNHHYLGEYTPALEYYEQSLAIRRAIGDRSGEGTTLNNISQIYQARGDFETALGYLEQSLAIQKAISDAAGLCATLFNMGHIYMQNAQPQEAVGAWLTVYRLARPMNLAQVLQALEGLAVQLGLPGGLDGWEALARQVDNQAP